MELESLITLKLSVDECNALFNEADYLEMKMSPVLGDDRVDISLGYIRSFLQKAFHLPLIEGFGRYVEMTRIEVLDLYVGAGLARRLWGEYLRREGRTETPGTDFATICPTIHEIIQLDTYDRNGILR